MRIPGIANSEIISMDKRMTTQMMIPLLTPSHANVCGDNRAEYYDPKRDDLLAITIPECSIRDAFYLKPTFQYCEKCKSIVQDARHSIVGWLCQPCYTQCLTDTLSKSFEEDPHD